MSESQEKRTEVSVNDRRRFDQEGNVKKTDASHGSAADAPDETSADPRDEEVQRLQAELDAARKRVDELARAYQALDKDREDFKQRLSRERERLIDTERGNVAVALLEAVDELDLCLVASAEDQSPLAQGVRLIRNSLLKRVEATGIERIDLLGQPYDPNVAEAADMEVTSNPDEDQQVTAVMRAGYRLKERVVRPARVKVAKYVKPADA